MEREQRWLGLMGGDVGQKGGVGESCDRSQVIRVAVCTPSQIRTPQHHGAELDNT